MLTRGFWGYNYYPTGNYACAIDNYYICSADYFHLLSDANQIQFFRCQRIWSRICTERTSCKHWRILCVMLRYNHALQGTLGTDYMFPAPSSIDVRCNYVPLLGHLNLITSTILVLPLARVQYLPRSVPGRTS
jgi:hypothetical protein